MLVNPERASATGRCAATCSLNSSYRTLHGYTALSSSRLTATSARESLLIEYVPKSLDRRKI